MGPFRRRSPCSRRSWLKRPQGTLFAYLDGAMPEECAPHWNRARRVLVVDDHADSAESMALLLRAMGYDARSANSGTTALALVGEFRPQVVLLDIGLPGMNGYEVAQRLRAVSRRRNLTLVAVTGYGQETDRERSRTAGFAHHLVKPVAPERLEAMLRAT